MHRWIFSTFPIRHRFVAKHLPLGEILMSLTRFVFLFDEKSIWGDAKPAMVEFGTTFHCYITSSKAAPPCMQCSLGVASSASSLWLIDFTSNVEKKHSLMLAWKTVDIFLGQPSEGYKANLSAWPTHFTKNIVFPYTSKANIILCTLEWKSPNPSHQIKWLWHKHSMHNYQSQSQDCHRYGREYKGKKVDEKLSKRIKGSHSFRNAYQHFSRHYYTFKDDCDVKMHLHKLLEHDFYVVATS